MVSVHRIKGSLSSSTMHSCFGTSLLTTALLSSFLANVITSSLFPDTSSALEVESGD